MRSRPIFRKNMGKKLGALKLTENCLIVFAKEPQLGRVKTRLRSVLSVHQCLSLYKAFLKDTHSIIRPLKKISRILAYDSLSEPPRYLEGIFKNYIFYQQEGRHLGQRMHRALVWAKRQGAQRIVIIGSDTPNLPTEYILEAFLRLKDNDLVLGPSEDGGYYLVGLKVPNYSLFKDIEWSSDKVLRQTINQAKIAEQRVSLLKKWQDIDDAKSLKQLKKSFRQSNRTRALWTRKILRFMGA